jgi:LuxR family maltose regulon positive regulatory protein
MRSPAPQRYAKLTPPRLLDALARERLYIVLDQLREHSRLVWISGPPGGGKTLLAGAYLDYVGGDALWCQLDGDDNEPATLLGFLAEAVALTPAEPAAFFPAFYAALPRDAIVVFDGVHELREAPALALLEAAAAAVPAGVTLLLLSRTQPPPALRDSGRMAVLDWDTLRFNAYEAPALARLAAESPPEKMDLLERLAGWPAGIAILRDQFAPAARDRAAAADTKMRLFRYFAGEVLDRMPERRRHLLLQMSCLSSLSAGDAEQLTGEADGPHVLATLHEQRWFVERHGMQRPAYHFNALFREFLQQEAALRLPEPAHTAMLERAGTLLSSRGSIAEAARMYHEAGAGGALAALLMRAAQEMIAASAGATWREWLRWLSPGVVAAHPWLLYWEGTSLMHADPAAARQVLIRARDALEADGDVRGALLTSCAVVDTYYYEWENFAQIGAWLTGMLAARARLDLAALDSETDLKLHSRLTLALFLVDAASPLLPEIAQRAMTVLPLVGSKVEQLAAAAAVLNYYNWADASAARTLAARFNHLADDPAIPALFRLVWWRASVFRAQFDNEVLLAEEMSVSARLLSKQTALKHFRFHFDYRIGMNALSMRDLPKTRQVLETLKSDSTGASRIEQAYLCALEARYLADLGDAEEARIASGTALACAEMAALPLPVWCHMTILHACCSALAGDSDGARVHAAAALRRAVGEDLNFAGHAQLLISAYLAQRAGDLDAALDAAAALLHDWRVDAVSIGMALICFPRLGSAVIALALRHGIGREFATGAVRTYRLRAPDILDMDWPWPIALHAFGRFEILRFREPVAATGKAQKRPLEVLKALLAAGNAGVSQQMLTAQLWPDAEDAKAALNVTIYRLRRLLGNDDAIVVAGGAVVLGESETWSDVAALACLCDRIEQMGGDTAQTETTAAAENLLALYRGGFCADDEEVFLLAARDRWRNRFLNAVALLGPLLERQLQWTLARQLYQRGADNDPLAEPIYRGLMRCAMALDEQPAATRAYKRCVDSLSIILGRQPSGETEKLAVELGLK